MYLISVFLLAIASNVDNLAVAIAYGVRKIKIGSLSNLVISLVTGIGTYISISVGKTISNYLAGSLSNLIGSFVLIAIGLWVIWETQQQEKKRNRDKFRLREQRRVSVASGTGRNISDSSTDSSFEQFYEGVSYESFIEEPEKADKDKSGYIDVKESIALALGLTINNLVIGVGAGICGFQVNITSFLSFILSLFAITGGYFLGDRFKVKMSRIWTGILSGCLLIGLGVYEYFIS